MNEDLFKNLKGKIIRRIITKNDEEMYFEIGRDEWYYLHHNGDYSNIWLAEIIGDLDDVVGSVIVEAELVKQQTDAGEGRPDNITEAERTRSEESGTWSFYKLRTGTGSVTLRWCGTSNGYYSEEVDYHSVPASRVPKPEEFGVLVHHGNFVKNPTTRMPRIRLRRRAGRQK